MRTFSVGLAVLLGAVLVFMAGAGFAADYLAYFWPADWTKRSEDYRFGYVAGVMDTLSYTQVTGVPGSNLASAFTCVKSKAPGAGVVMQAVGTQLGANPQNSEAVTATVVTVLDGCKLPAQTGSGNTVGKSNNGNTPRRRP